MDFAPIIYISFGAIIGFIGNYILETYKRKYELKRQIYFEFIDVMAQGRILHCNEELINGLYERDPNSLPSEEVNSWSTSFEAVKNKMEISASDEIKTLIKTEWLDASLSRFDMIEEFYKKLLPLIKSDLIKKKW